MGFLAGFHSSRKISARRFLGEALKLLKGFGKSWTVWAYLDGETYENPRLERLDVEVSTGLLGGYLKGVSDGCMPVEVTLEVLLAGSGRIFNPEGWSELRERLAEKPALDSLKLAGLRVHGNYVLALIGEGGLWLLRDPSGFEPLYIYSSPELTVFSQVRTPLWRLGFRRLRRLNPGEACKISGGEASFFPIAPLQNPGIVKLSLQEAVNLTAREVLEAFQVRAKNVKGRVGVLFSGGLDSSLTALILKNLGLKPTLYTAGFEGSGDLEAAEEAAEILELPLQMEILRSDEVENLVEEAVKACERCRPIDVGVTIPLLSAAGKARREGVNLLFSGQGFDELHAGYARYLRVAEREGWKRLAQNLYQDVLQLPRETFEREWASAFSLGVRMELPASDLKMAMEALKIPPRLKVLKGEGGLRKRVLRKAALKLGLPEALALKPKKAVQFGSGTMKTLKSLTGKFRLKVEDYLHEVFFKVFGLRPEEA